MNLCPYTEEKCNSVNCAKCNIYLEIEYGCDGNCNKCKDTEFCDHFGKKE